MLGGRERLEMNDHTERSDVPDVEAIVADIRKTVREAEQALAEATEAERAGPTLEELAEGERVQANLYDNLHAANSTYVVGGKPPMTGLKAKARDKVYNLIDPLVKELNEFNVNVVRTLNKLVKIFDGHDTQVSSELLMKTQRRVDLLAQLSDRLAALDDFRIEERLRGIEERLDQLEKREES